MSYTFDHAMCAVTTLRAGAVVYGNLGFTPDEGGRHTVGTQNSVVPLERGYLELLSVYDDASARKSPRHRLICEYLDREGGGLIGFALRTDTITADAERLSGSGLSFEGPVQAERVRPDGEVLTWQVLRVTPQPCPAVLPMLVAGDQSAPDFEGNRNAVTRCVGIALVTAAGGELVKTYQALLGLESSGSRERPGIAANATVFDIDGFSIEILEPSGPGPTKQALDRYGDSPFELSFRAGSLAPIESLLGLSAARGQVVIPAEMSLGVRMVVMVG